MTPGSKPTPLSSTTSVETWQLRKPAVTGKGLVATQHYAASEIGAKVLSSGGNAIDAAVAASLAIGTVEPWMSGLGGGGLMLYYEAATDKVHSIDFGMRAPGLLDPADFPVESGQDDDLFGWPSVKENRNVQGPYSFAVPGYLAGIDHALKAFGSQSLAELINPAIESAHQGIPVDWYTTLKIAAAAPGLSRYDESAATYLSEGFVPAGEWGGPLPQLKLGHLANTLENIQARGVEDFYTGETAAQLVKDCQALGSCLSLKDLSDYTVTQEIAVTSRYRNADIWSAPGLTAGPTLADVLTRLETHWKPASVPDKIAFVAYADALSSAYNHRLQTMGDVDDSSNPGCTTHLTVTDSQGNMVSLTQTLLSVFGSKVMLPQTGILMNNGIMWFDPRAGYPNSIGAGKRPLSNMCPAIFRTAAGNRYALGASGGRRIMPSVAQLISFIIDHGMSVESAVHQARIDVSGSHPISVDESLGSEVIEALAKHYPVQSAPNGVYPSLFACPSMVMTGENTEQTGAAFIASPWAKVCAAVTPG